MTFNTTPTNINGDQENYPATANVLQLNVLMNLGEGLGATIVGQPYSVYRITSGSNGDFIAPGNVLFKHYLIERQKLKAGDLGLESVAKNMTFFFQVISDFLPFQTGDVFVLHAPLFNAGQESVIFSTPQYVGFCFTQGNPLYNKNAARLDRQIIVERPAKYTRPDGVMDSTTSGALPLICTAGVFGLGVNGQIPSLIPAGMMQISRTKGVMYNEVPDALPHTQWACYVPPLKGWTFREGDIIIEAYNLNPATAANPTGQIMPTRQARYRVVNPFYQEAGAVGAQMLLEREVSSRPQ